MGRSIVILYIALLHIGLAAAVLRPDVVASQHWRLNIGPPEPMPHVQRLHDMFRALDSQRSAARTILVGDSHFQRMDSNLLEEPVLNFGIGHDTLRFMKERLAGYKVTTGNADQLVLWGGQNDLRKRDVALVFQDLSTLLDSLDVQKSPVILAVPPVAVGQLMAQELNVKIVEYNDRVKARCTVDCSYLDVHALLSDEIGGLSRQYDSGDGIHLNAAGYALVSAAINAQLARGAHG
jgi:hypothetical protein